MSIKNMFLYTDKKSFIMQYIFSVDSRIVSKDRLDLNLQIFPDAINPLVAENKKERRLIEFFHNGTDNTQQFAKLKNLKVNDLKIIIDDLGLDSKSNLSKEEYIDILRIYLRIDE